jgi:hypothetical protein
MGHVITKLGAKCQWFERIAEVLEILIFTLIGFKE